MEKSIERCIKPHALIHTIMGVGIGLALPTLIPKISGSAFVLGIAVVFIAMVGELIVFGYNKK